jgi:hypothetical protein
MGLFRIARELRIDPFAGVYPAAAITQSLRERSVLIGVLARRVSIPYSLAPEMCHRADASGLVGR